MRHFISIDSDDRVAGKPTDFRISLSQGLLDVQHLVLVSASFSYTWYIRGACTIDESAAGGSSFVLDLDEINRAVTQAQLATEMETQMNTKTTAGITYTVTFNSATYKYTFATGGPSVTMEVVDASPDFNRNIGFKGDSNWAGASIDSDGVSNLNESYINLLISPVPTNINGSNSLARNFMLPLLGNWGDVIHVNSQTSWLQSVMMNYQGRSIRDLEIQLQHWDGSIVDTLNGGKVHLVFSYITYDDRSPFFQNKYSSLGYPQPV